MEKNQRTNEQSRRKIPNLPSTKMPNLPNQKETTGDEFTEPKERRTNKTQTTANTNDELPRMNRTTRDEPNHWAESWRTPSQPKKQGIL